MTRRTRIKAFGGRWAKGLILLLALVGLMVACTDIRPAPRSAASTPSAARAPASSSIPALPPLYQQHDLPRATVHSLLIPAGGKFLTVPALSPTTASLESFMPQHQAIAAINGGFFDPQNQQSTSFVMLQGERVADPTQNQRLMQNPDLSPYLDQILNRSELRRYQCDAPRHTYAIARHQEAVPSGCRLLDALGAGPQLLPSLTLESEGFTALDASGHLVRDSLGSRQPNARSAVGITADGSLLWVMVAQKPDRSEAGLSLPELAAFMQSQGAVAALNLDGGSSAALVYQQKKIHGKLEASGQPVQRPVKSVLLLIRSPA